MLENPSLFTRITIGKAIGLLFGIIGLILLLVYVPDPGWPLAIGVLFWYSTLGAIIGAYGVFTWHPVLHLPMPWWFRAPLVGAWLNFVAICLAYETLQETFIAVWGAGHLLTSPWWLVPEGAVVGLIIGYAATSLGGEGRETVPA